MKYTELLENQLVDEIKMLSHTAKDDAEITAVINKLYTTSQERNLRQVGTINDLRILTTNPSPYRYFFVDKNNNLQGSAKVESVVIKKDDKFHDDGYHVSLIFFIPSARHKGYGIAFYKWFIDQGYTLYSDNKQSKMGKNVWAKLATMYNVTVVDAYGNLLSANSSDAYDEPGFRLKISKNKLNETAFLDDEPNLVLRLMKYWDQRSELGDSNSAPTTEDEIKNIQSKLKQITHSGTITIYRRMVIKNINSIEETSPLGQAWSYEEKKAHPYNVEKSGRNVYLFTAEVSVGNIDWLSTIALDNMGESEIRLKPDAPIKLISIQDSFYNQVRKELNNNIFSATS